MNGIHFRVCRRDSVENELARRRKLNTSLYACRNKCSGDRYRFFGTHTIQVLVTTESSIGLHTRAREKHHAFFTHFNNRGATRGHTRVSYNRKYS